MTSLLPERPNLEQLKRQAKDLLASTVENNPPAARERFRVLPAFAEKSAPELAALSFALHDAQSVLAREYGFPSWNALRERVEELTLAFDDALKDFLACAIDGRAGRAQRLLASHPGIARANFHTTLVLGDAEGAEWHLSRHPGLATRRGGPRDWEPILYVCLTSLHRGGLASAEGLVAIARRLLALGADANTSFAWHEDPSMPLSALWGASCQLRLRPLAELLLAAGARPDDGESMYHAAENGDLPMLELLHAHGAAVDGGAGNRWNNTPLYFILGHTESSAAAPAARLGIRWLLEHGADASRVCYPDKSAETPLHAAARNWDVPVVELLVQHGATVRARRGDGRTAYALAALHGNHAVAEWLAAHDGGDVLTGGERFLAACTRGDRRKAEAMLRGEPSLQTAVTNPQAQKLFIKLAGRDDTGPLETMLACGFDAQALDEIGATALHYAALGGHLAAARLLLAHGARTDIRDKNYQALPLGWTDYGSVQMRRAEGDYVGVALALLQAGSPVEGDDSSRSDDVQTALAQFRASQTART